MALPLMKMLALKADPYVDARGPLEIFRRAEADQTALNRENLLKRVGGIAAGGDYLGASREAMAGGAVRTGSALDAFQRRRQGDLMSAISSAAQRGDTPEKWARVIQTLGRTYGPEAVEPYRSFERRKDFLAALGVTSPLDAAKIAHYGAQTGKLIAETGQIGKGGPLGGYKTLKDKATVESGIRKEFVKSSGDFIKLRDAYGKIKTSIGNESAAGDMSMIFNYMKMLDPGSTVREGEYATAEQATSVPGRVLNLYNKTLKGEFLTKVQRADFRGVAGRIYNKQRAQYRKLRGQYEGMAKRLGLDQGNVLLDLEPPADVPLPPAPVPALPPDEVERGRGRREGHPLGPVPLGGPKLEKRSALPGPNLATLAPMEIVTPRGTKFRSIVDAYDRG